MISPHIVFILGAGASVQAGIPSMQNFLDKTDSIVQRLSFRDLLHSDNIKDAFNDVKETKAYLNQIYHKANIDLDNIEHLYGALYMAKIFGGLGNWDIRKINFKLKNLEYIIIRTIEDSMIMGIHPEVKVTPKPYDQFIELLNLIQKRTPTTDISIISFNYDIAFEVAHINEKSIRGFEYCLDGNSYDYRKIKLLKLHGSLNWAETGKGKINYYDLYQFHKPPEYLIKQSMLAESILPIASYLMEYKVMADFKKIAIIPPSFNKRYSSISLQNVWREAAKQLSEAESIYVSGFSLNNADNFFRYLFSIGTINNTNLRNFEVFNFNEDDELNIATRDRYFNLIGQGIKNRFRYHNQTFEKMILDLIRFYS